MRTEKMEKGNRTLNKNIRQLLNPKKDSTRKEKQSHYTHSSASNDNIT